MAAATRIRRARKGTVLALAGAVIAAMISGSVGVAPAHADSAPVVEPPRPAFYEQPESLPANNGDLVRSEKMTFLLDPLDASSLVKQSWRIMYRTTDRVGTPIAVTGTVMVPNSDWIGVGSRPVIGYAPGTQGLADRCAPSRQYTEGLEYEDIGVQDLLARGYAVVMPDYEGLGTAGVHTYMERVSQGHATLDAIRAAQRLAGTGLSAASPVGLQGYSQGGGAAAAAVELAPTYAPELRLKGAILGAIPADLEAVATNLDGSMFSAFAFFALRGLAASYDIDFRPYLNEDGVQAMTDVEQDCVFDLFSNAFVRSETLSKDGQSLADLMQVEPFRSVIADQRIGTLKPAVPVLVDQSLLDDVIPYRVGKQVARDWCDQGANVRFSTNLGIGHVGGFTPHLAAALPFWEARFAGLPQLSNCWTL